MFWGVAHRWLQILKELQMTTTNFPKSESNVHFDEGVCGPFQKITFPGCFIVKRTGELLRIPEDALAPGRSPTMDIVSKEPWMVTKISSDPYLPLNKARAVAADMDLFVNF